jgi:hypothetical protein
MSVTGIAIISTKLRSSISSVSRCRPAMSAVHSSNVQRDAHPSLACSAGGGTWLSGHHLAQNNVHGDPQLPCCTGDWLVHLKSLQPALNPASYDPCFLVDMADKRHQRRGRKRGQADGRSNPARNHARHRIWGRAPGSFFDRDQVRGGAALLVPARWSLAAAAESARVDETDPGSPSRLAAEGSFSLLRMEGSSSFSC